MGASASVLDESSQRLLYSDIVKIYDEERGEEKACYNRVQSLLREALPRPPGAFILKKSATISADFIAGGPLANQPDIFNVGDVVKVFDDGFFCEGVIVDKYYDLGSVKIDFGDSSGIFKESDCSLVVASTDYEVGDKVEVKPDGSGLFFRGHVLRINHQSGTFDVVMDGDDPDDVETDVSIDCMRKIMTSRKLVVERWKKAIHGVIAMQAFVHLGHLHHMRELHDDDAITH